MNSSGKNRNLNKAQAAKYDEFYTQASDIDNELYHYTKHFKGKTIYCNCDDPRRSNFFSYFARQSDLGYKKLIATCYQSQNADLFSKRDSKCGLVQVFTRTKNENLIPDPEEIGVKKLQGDGDFRSPECVELLKQADIVCTNPPFSLFREYIAQLMKHKKKFIIIGNPNAISYKEIFPLIKENKIWLGVTPRGKMRFQVPDWKAEELKKRGKKGTVQIDEDGKVKVNTNSTWFTNLPHKKRNEELKLVDEYSPKKYPKYDNFDAINVDKTVFIPKDYDGVMGVPISFLDKYNPNQFKIIGSDVEVTEKANGKGNRLYCRGKRLYARILIQRISQ